MKALGLIETIGLTAAIEAADTAVKSADATLLGYENTRGGGLITVKLTGDVGAVKAAVEAAAAAAAKVGGVYSTKVIPRPAEGINKIIFNTPPAPSAPEYPAREEQAPAGKTQQQDQHQEHHQEHHQENYQEHQQEQQHQPHQEYKPEHHQHEETLQEGGEAPGEPEEAESPAQDSQPETKEPRKSSSSRKRGG
jgi:microcompartment protein CcmL/EutN